MGSILVEKVQKQTRHMEMLIYDVVSMEDLAKPISYSRNNNNIILLLLKSSKDGMNFQICSKLGQEPQAFLCEDQPLDTGCCRYGV